MIGLVNKAIEGLVCSAHGEETWDEIVERAGVGDAHFLGMDPYPDAVTYDLVGAAAEVLQTEAADLLRAFGEYWTTYVVDEGYGHLLEMHDGGFVSFLSRLDEMHGRVGLVFDGLQPPSFRCEDEQESQVVLRYYSDRPGLAPMIEGLVLGLGRRFDLDVSVEQITEKGDHADHDAFRICW